MLPLIIRYCNLQLLHDTKMNNVKFKNQVKPGDTLESVCTLTKSKGVFYFIDAKGYVDGKLCVSAELSFALIPNNK